MRHRDTLIEIERLKTRLFELPDQFYTARQAVHDADRRVRDLKGEIADAELEELLIASNAKGKDDKPMYTNEAARKAAVAKALAKSPTHQDRLKRLADAETALAEAKMRLARIEDEQRTTLAIADLIGSEVALLTRGAA